MISEELKAYFERSEVCKILESDQQYIVYYSNTNQEELEKFFIGEHTLMFILKGNKGVVTPNHYYQIEEGEAIFIKKGSILINEKLIQGNQNSGIFIFLKEEFIVEFVDKYQHMLHSSEAMDIKTWGAYQYHMDSWMQVYISSLISYFQVLPLPAPELLSNKLNELLLVLILGQERTYFISFLREILMVRQSAIDTVLQSNIYRNLNVDHLAFLSNKSLSQFKREFKKKYNDSPANWIRIKRLEYSSHLLISTDKSVNDICWESGFSNVSHFCQLFQKQYGTSPLKYRNVIRD
ncbi:helix-turn-helix domain-containing protein [Labilibaculum antarcticum]|uniref:AraC family transcriptional regulator n=1 Tax=Labilibaculum antarcticum TaxID=1717717 RepID=A0A1Y1CNE1_9BACT|nr:helix-turn-helix domain-containing protein [Labilibaculum antarcticum]BAX81959.1 AraC family transcriptional regulator [Labilibaculum antarcticum]